MFLLQDHIMLHKRLKSCFVYLITVSSIGSKNKTVKKSEMSNVKTTHSSGHNFGISWQGSNFIFVFDSANFSMPKYGHVQIRQFDSSTHLPMKYSTQSDKPFTGMTVAMDLFQYPGQHQQKGGWYNNKEFGISSLERDFFLQLYFQKVGIEIFLNNTKNHQINTLY